MSVGVDKTFGLLENMLDVSALRHKVVANNIANVNTPGYKKMVVNFEEELEKAVENSSQTNFKKFQPKVIISEDVADGTLRNDGNTVDMEKEVATLLKNTGSYKIYSQLLAKKFDLVKAAIDGSKG
ncbi:MAG: flagellar basal body rod protein FlgB [Candidatus Kuenenia sp.]|nr:flagellar basal body rod protein FlgB [Candidatus Kuenenia hertensis]